MPTNFDFSVHTSSKLKVEEHGEATTQKWAIKTPELTIGMYKYVRQGYISLAVKLEYPRSNPAPTLHHPTPGDD